MLIYSRAIPESDQEPLQWPEDVVVRGSATFLFFSISVLRCVIHYSGPFSATISFSLEIPRRVLLVPPRVKSSKYLFHRLLPYPASLRRWKCPSLLESPWTCPTETRRETVYVLYMGVPLHVRAAMGRPHAQCPHCYFFCYFVIRYNWTAYCKNLLWFLWDR